MPQKKWDTETDHNRAQDNTGFTNDGLGDHLGRHRIQRGYEYGSLTRGLVAYYPMDEGQGQVLHDGALGNLGQINGATWNGSGQVGSDALDFDGTDDYVDLGTPILDEVVGTRDFTVSAWANLDSKSSSQYVVVEAGGSNHNRFYLQYESSNDNWRFVFEQNDSTSVDVTVDASGYSTGNWVHLTAVWASSGTAWIYVDGTTSNSVSHSGTLEPTTVTTKFAARGGGQNLSLQDFSDLQIDDVRIYDRALSQPEIEALYNITSPSGREVTESDVPSASQNGVSRYEFENDVTDSWGTNDGTDNTSAGYVDGVFGQAKDFDGTDDYVSLPDLGLSSSSSFTWTFWFVEPNPAGGDQDAIYGRSDGTNIMEGIINGNGVLQAYYGHSGGKVLNATGSAINAGEWYHGAVVYDASTSELITYLNGTRDASDSGTVDDFATANGPWIGARNDSSLWFDGVIDDVRIYSRALDPIEVETLFNKGAWRINRGDVL